MHIWNMYDILISYDITLIIILHKSTFNMKTLNSNVCTYVYLIDGNNLNKNDSSVFRQSAIDFHRAVALMQLQLRTRDLSSWW